MITDSWFIPITLKVMAGDTIEISAKAFYNIDNAMSNQGISIVPVIGAALAAMTNPASTISGETSQLSTSMRSTANNVIGLSEPPQRKQPVKEVQPKSGLNFVLYNNLFEVVDENTGYLPVEDHINTIQILATDQMIMKEAGFIEIFVNNDANTPVYYDNLMVAHSGGAVNVLEVNAYYHLGGIMPGLSLTNTTAPNRYKFNGKEAQPELGLQWLDYGARMYEPYIGRFWTPDPLAEMRYNLTPYHFCSNNPINRIDPDGLTDFSLNRRTGDIRQIGEMNDDLDRILRTNRHGEVKYDRKGEAKVAFGDIEKGILEDGMNFQTNSYTFSVNGTGQPTTEGVEAFVLNMSDYVGREIGGAYFSKDGAASTTHMSIGRYQNNSYRESKSSGHISFLQKYPESNFGNSLTGFFHTHPSGGTISVSDRTRASEQDLKSKAEALKHNPHLQFFIITQPTHYRGKIRFPY